MEKRIRVAVLFGGKSGEHEVSLHSAASVIQAMDLLTFEVYPILINRQGDWLTGEQALSVLEGKLEAEKLEAVRNQKRSLSIHGKNHGFPFLKWGELDVVFPVLHGTFGEDGTIQGLLEIADIPYVGAGVMASAVGMDKVMMKKLFAQEGLPQGKYTYFLRTRLEQEKGKVLDEVEAAFGYPCFVKPANLGSSVGISKAIDRKSLSDALKLAARYDRKVVVEEFIQAREVEVAVLGNDHPQVSVPGEIVSSGDFYDYEAKYVSGTSELRIPADLPEEKAEAIRRYALQAYQGIDCSGLARVDFFVRDADGEVLINEINTMPGFTPFSMYANLWQKSGLSYSHLVSKLVDLALERYQDKKKSITDFTVE
ncbi:D-alanine--D-alanine ligase [Kroppenstedtia pulmonis]|uniref:D-alanine--D-alanine ligase n=1 Tax=Kroppenstedtia pulmonis TaxID=1380685 RepID=A0A7D3XR71_9BACL|nr:D-alanine--D-alanine ligase [Kroppenstedtia pulmonis]QKG84068.1 D-alanine--D-alanine ligase [Kroppenstedtia pulmonis]